MSRRRLGATVLGDAGFTIMRMLVTAALISAVATAAMPSLSATHRAYQIRGGAREIYSELENARMLAVTRNETIGFALVGTSQYEVFPDPNRNGIRDGGEVATSTKTLGAASHGITLSASTPGVGVSFRSNGTAPTNGSFVVQNPQGDSIAVSVARAGRIRIQ